MSNFRNSTLEELYGPSRLTEPPIMGQINWKQVAIQSVITIAIIGLPVVCIYTIIKAKEEELLKKIDQKLEDGLAKLKEEQQIRNEAIVQQVFEQLNASLNDNKTA